jgi:ATP-dependent DNA helicase RecQ
LEDKENLKATDVEMLFQRLRLLRKHLADEQSVPPYVVFADSTLRLMAQVQPQTLTQFGKLSGVGSHKLNQYGERFVAEIKAYCQEQGQQIRTDPANSTIATAVFPSDTQLLTLQLHRQGLSVEEIAQKRGFTCSTVIAHLIELIDKNQPVDLNQLVIPVRQQLIVKAIQTVGTASLKSIYEHLGQSYSYDEIRLVRAWWRRNNG